MRKLPDDIVKLLQDIPLRDKRRAYIINQVNWRLDRGRIFTASEIAKTARFRTSVGFVASVIDSLILLGYVVVLPAGGYGPTSKHKVGCDAMVKNFAMTAGSFKRKDVWMGIKISLPLNEIDRILRRLVESGEIEKFDFGIYGTPQAVRQAA